MKFRTIVLENFHCFYGDDNVVHLNDGLNVFVGLNGAGKSSLFNAFSWCLTNRYYADGSWNKISSPSQMEVLVNQGAMESAGGAGVNVGVSIGFELEDEELGYTDLLLKRYFRWNGFCGDWDVLLSFMDGNDRREVSDKEQVEKMLKGWIDPAIQRFMMFQGETLDELVDFKANGSLRALTMKISAFNTFADMLEDVELFSNYADKRFRKEISDNSRASSQSIELNSKLDGLNKRYVAKKRSIEELKSEIQDGEDALEAALETIKATADNAEEVRAVDEKEHRQKLAGMKLTAAFDRLRDMHLAGRLLGSFAPDQDGFFVGLSEVQDRISARRAELNAVPRLISIEVPRESDLKRLIEAEKCDVCGTEAKEGSPAHQHMTKRLEEMQNVSVQNQELRRLDSLQQEIPEILSRFSSLRRESLELKEDLEKTHATVSDKFQIARSELKAAKSALTAEASARDQFDNAKRAESRLKPKIATKRVSLADAQGDLKDIQLQIEQKKRQLKSLPGVSAVDEKFERADLLGKAAVELFKVVKDHEKSALLKAIEKESNRLLRQLSDSSSSFIANLKVNMDSMSFDPVDAQGRTGVDNKGLVDMCSIAVLTAVLKLVKEEEGSDIPHVADAPTSALDPINRLNYLKVNSSEYGQSIVLSKDFSVEELKSLGCQLTVYRLLPSRLDGTELGGQKASRSDLMVGIEKVEL